MRAYLSGEPGSVNHSIAQPVGRLYSFKAPIQMAGKKDRAAYRTKCRKILSENICKAMNLSKRDPTHKVLAVVELGISSDPGDVRLITGMNDPYTWKMLTEKQDLFKKHLSKHSIGAYRELCREVGVSFEAEVATKTTCSEHTR